MKNSQRILKRLEELKVIITGSHFVYASGKHGSAYVNKDEVYTDPDLTFDVCDEIALLISVYIRPMMIDEFAIISPAVGGVALSQHTTRHLKDTFGYKAVALYADKEETAFELPENSFIRVGKDHVKPPAGAKFFYSTGSFVVKRGYDKKIASVKGQKVVVVEDLLTTGGSVKATVDAVRKVGGDVVMVAALCNRGAVTAEMIGVPHLNAFMNVNLEAFDEVGCPLCAAGVPINTSVGHGKAFLARKALVQSTST